MTTLNLNAAVQAGVANAIAGSIVQGMAYSIAQGVMAQFFRPLGAGPFAFAQLPGMFSIAAGMLPTGGGSQGIVAGGCYRPDLGPCGPIVIAEPRQQWSATLGQNGQGSIDLGDGYELKLNENSSEVTVLNRNTGESTRIWGDPHVEIDGKQAFDFWGTTTFALGNGTKITINTEQWNGNPNAYVANQLVITRGNQALTVDGLSQNRLGDLSITHGNNGYALDAATRDGFVLNENMTGAGWRSELTGQVATQADLNATAIGGEYGPGSEAQSLGELGEQLTGWLMLGFLMGAVAAPAAPDTGFERAIERATNRAVMRAFSAV